jgi:hypothetical protein
MPAQGNALGLKEFEKASADGAALTVTLPMI